MRCAFPENGRKTRIRLEGGLRSWCPLTDNICHAADNTESLGTGYFFVKK